MSKNMRNPADRGWILVELAIASAPLAIIALALFSVLLFVMAFSHRAGISMEAAQQARIALNLIAQELREASAAPGAIAAWSRDEGALYDGVGFLTAPAGNPGSPPPSNPAEPTQWQHEAVYYLVDSTQGSLWRVASDANTIPPPLSWRGGRLLARNVARLRVTDQHGLLIITLALEPSSGGTVLETAVRPRN